MVRLVLVALCLLVPSVASARGASLAGLPRPLVSIIVKVERACPGMHPVSTYRPRAIVRGTHERSLHATRQAADISGGSYGCAYRVLRGFPGGVSTDGSRMHHIHLSYAPGSREWGRRFVHGGPHRRHHRRR